LIDLSFRERLLATSMICGAALLLGAGSASAQETPQQDAANQSATEVGEVVVTGSRIPQPNLTSVSPVQVVGDEEITLGGRPLAVDILNQLPQITQNSQTGFSSTGNPLSGPGGVATIDLRGLGQQRTLVLVDGRRLGIGDPNTGNPNPAPDINQIPSQLIERIEVLTGGASATYGSDAVAGVVNFVMKRDFEGFQVDAQLGAYQHEQHNEFMQNIVKLRDPLPDDAFDGRSEDIAVIFGVNAPDGRGNVTAFFTHHNQDPVLQNARDYSACQLNVPSNGFGTPACAGSSNSNLFYRADGTPGRFAVVGNQFAPYSTTANTTPPPLFNSNNFSHLIQQSTRYTAGYFARYEINKNIELYSDFNMMNDRTNVQIAPTGLFQASGSSPTGGFLVNCNNPLMSAQQQATFCTPAQIAAGDSVDLYIGRRNIEGGGRNSFYEHQNFRAVIGARGEIAGPFNYDLYTSYYYTNLYTASQNYLSISRIQNGLQVVQTPTGPQCISGGGCVPYNIFQEGGVTQAALDYLDIQGTARGEVTQRIVEGVVTGDLSDYGIKSPFATDGVGVAAGYQFRRENLQFQPDVAQLSGDLSGAGGASTPIDNSISVRELYTEARVPLIQDAPFADEILLEAGYRYSDYSIGIETNTYKVGLQWSPSEDIRFRGSYQSAIRAPSILELYTPQSVTNSASLQVDPCAPTQDANGNIIPATATFEQCARTGVTAAQYGNGGTTNTIVQCPSGQCAVLTGGNPDLQAEEAKTFSLGFTTTPRFLPGLVASLDYFHIELEGTIGTVGQNILVNKCLAGDQSSCSQVVRATNGTLFGTSQATGGYVNGTGINVGAGTTEGIDLQANYDLPLEDWGFDRYGDLRVSLIGTYLLKTTTIPVPGDPEYDCAGLFGPTCQTVNPEWRHTLRLIYTTPFDVQVSAAWRYIGTTTLDTISGEPTISAPGNTEGFNRELPERSYLDLSATWQLSDALTFRAGVNNVLDQDPPLVRNGVASTGQPNSFQTYDLLGRRLFVGLTASF
jgi:outer membrane receptor protein involved in Fe transport